MRLWRWIGRPLRGIFQETIRPKIDLRVTVIEDRVYTAAILKANVDLAKIGESIKAVLNLNHSSCHRRSLIGVWSC